MTTPATLPLTVDPYQYLSYEQQWRSYATTTAASTTSHTDDDAIVVFDVCWWEENKEREESTSYLLACTNQGDVCVWKVPPSHQDDIDEDKNPGDRDHLPTRPFRRWKAGTDGGVLYSIQLSAATDQSKNCNKQLLILTGDEGVIVYDWSDTARRHILAVDNDSKPPKPLTSFKPHPSPFEGNIEVNQAACDDHGFLYGAGGDSFGCYKWEIESGKLINTYPSPGRGYLHTLQLVSPLLDQKGTRHLLVGGEDGILSIWDIRQDKLVDQKDMNTLDTTTTTTTTTTSNNSRKIQSSALKRKAPPSSSRFISSLTQVNESWWTVGGGTLHQEQNHNKQSSGMMGRPFHSQQQPLQQNHGFLATYHEPTRSLIACTETREAILKLECTGNNPGNDGTSNSLYSLGNTDTVTTWNPWTLERRQSTWFSTPCGYAMAMSSDGQRIAAAGVGQRISLIENNQVLLSLSVN